MDDDLEATVSIPYELGGESCSRNVDEELVLFEHEETCQDIFPYNFDITFTCLLLDTLRLTFTSNVKPLAKFLILQLYYYYNSFYTSFEIW